MNRVERIGSEPTSRLLAEFSLPAIVAIFVQSTYSIIDRIFIGNGAGTLAISGITLCFPVIAVFMAFGMLIGIGGSSLYSIKLGSSRDSEYRKIPGNTLFLLILVSVTLSILTGMFLNEILVFFGASGESLNYASQYLGILLFGLPFQTAGFGMNNFIRAEGSPGTAMATMLIGTGINLILAPLFIFILHTGVQGAALSTVIAQVVSCIWVISFFRSGKGLITLGSEEIRFSAIITLRSIYTGLGPFFMQAGACLTACAYSHQLMTYGGGLAVSVYGILHSITVFLLMPVIGISQGSQPLIGYNYGAGRLGRVKSLLFKSIAVSAFIILAGFTTVLCFPGFFISIFNPADVILRKEGVHALQLFILMLPLAALQVCASGYFLAAGKPKYSVLLTLSRQIFFLLPLLLILPAKFGLDGVWMAAPVSDCAAFIITSFMISREFRKQCNQNHVYMESENHPFFRWSEQSAPVK